MWVSDGDDAGQPAPPTCVQGEGDQAAELTLGHRAEAEQRLLGHPVAPVLLLDGEVADLGPVAVHDARRSSRRSRIRQIASAMTRALSVCSA